MKMSPFVTFLGVDRCDLEQPDTFADADIVIIGAPYDAGTSYRAQDDRSLR